MKNSIITLLIVASIIAGGVYMWKKNLAQVMDTVDVVTPEPTVREMCYIWNTEAGDKATLRMSITDGTKVKGRFDFLPAETDENTGPFEGIAGPLDQKTMARTADLWWTATAEGMTTKQELKVMFGDGTASAGFGEMKDRGDGVYVYANPAKITYTPTLSQTDCGDPVAQ